MVLVVASFFAPRYDKWGADYDALLQLLDASCRRLGLRHVVISDKPRPAPLETALFDLPANLMMAFLDGQRQFLAATPGPVLLVGADCLLTRDPTPIFGGDLTITTSKRFLDCPMNSGAIFCTDGPTCAPVWQAAVDREPTEWGEDQTALYAAISESVLDVRERPAEAHNWAPRNVLDRAGTPTVVHFRGARKQFMPAWAARHLGL